MGLPDAADQVTTAPLKALRAVFAEIGRLLIAAEADLREEPEEQPADDQYDVFKEWSRQPSTSSPAVIGESVAPASAEDLPIAAYDDLSLPSLRSRLRWLDATALRVLLDHERSHGRRDDVIGMLERRIAKLGPTISDAT